MKRFPKRLAIFVLVAIAGALFLVWWNGPTHRLTRAMHESIQKG